MLADSDVFVESSSDDPILLTPGPLATSPATKRAMMHDWGSRDREVVSMTARARARLLALAGATENHVCVPLQGSGTFAIEAAIGTLVPRGGKLLVPVNGAYGQRMVRIAEVLGLAHVATTTPENLALDPEHVGAVLDSDPAIGDVAAVHCETSSGVLNPVAEIARLVDKRGKRLLVDAMSAFGAIPLDAAEVPFDSMVSSSSKCLEGVPGLAFVIARRDSLAKRGGNARSLSLDLHDQWRTLERTGEWRFTPPTQVLAALDQALTELDEEGGIAARGGRYRRNRDRLVKGMREMGFATLLADDVQAPIIVTFLAPADPNWRFETFFAGLRRRNYVIYPGKLTAAESFRVGCIGHLGNDAIPGLIEAVRATIDEMGLVNRGPAPGQ